MHKDSEGVVRPMVHQTGVGGGLDVFLNFQAIEEIITKGPDKIKKFIESTYKKAMPPKPGFVKDTERMIDQVR